MKNIFKFILLTALRDWLFLGLVIMIIASYGISSLLGYSALVENMEMQVVYFSSVARVITICGIILFICFHIRRSFEHKEIEFMLSRNISRYNFVLSYWFSFNVISLILFIPTILILTFLNNPNITGLLFWSISLLLESMLISTFAIVSSLILKSAVSSVMASFSFYILSRLMGFFVYSIKTPQSINSVSSISGFSEGILKIISIAFPRLDLFTQSEWLVYGLIEKEKFIIILIQSIIYIPLMLFVAFYDFKKKQF